MALDELMRTHKGPLSANEVNQLVRTIAELKSRIQNLEHSLTVMPQQAVPILGRIVGRVNPAPDDHRVPPVYYFELLGDGANGTPSRNWQGAIRGTTAQLPAYERSGNRNVPIDGSAIVQLVASEAQGAYFFTWSDARASGRITTNVGGGKYLVQPQYRSGFFPDGEWVDSPGVAEITVYESSYSDAVDVGSTISYYRGPSGGAPRIITEHSRYGDGTYWAKQNVSLVGAVGGTFRLIAYPNFDFSTVASTAGIAWDGDAAAVQAALNGLPAYIPGAAAIVVSGGNGSLDHPFVVEYPSDNNARPLLMGDESGLVGQHELLFDKCCSVSSDDASDVSDTALIEVLDVNSTTGAIAWSLASQPRLGFPSSGNFTCNPAYTHGYTNPIIGSNIGVECGSYLLAQAIDYRDPAANLTIGSNTGLNQSWTATISNATAGNFTLTFRRYNTANDTVESQMIRTFSVGSSASAVAAELTLSGFSTAASVNATLALPNMTYGITLTKANTNYVDLTVGLGDVVGNTIVGVDSAIGNAPAHKVSYAGVDVLQTFYGSKEIAGLTIFRYSPSTTTRRAAAISDASNRRFELEFGPPAWPCENATAPMTDDGTLSLVMDDLAKRVVIGAKEYGTGWPEFPFGHDDNPTAKYSVLRGDGTIVDGETTGANGGVYGANDALGLKFFGGIFAGVEAWLLSARSQPGSILVSDGSGWSYLAPGADGTVLTANSSAPLGIEWV